MTTVRMIRREKFGLNQAEFADAVGVTQPTVSRWESGSVPTFTHLAMIRQAAEKRGIEWDDAWFGEIVMPKQKPWNGPEDDRQKAAWAVVGESGWELIWVGMSRKAPPAHGLARFIARVLFKWMRPLINHEIQLAASELLRNGAVIHCEAGSLLSYDELFAAKVRAVLNEGYGAAPSARDAA